jgi:hypothetical protein
MPDQSPAGPAAASRRVLLVTVVLVLVAAMAVHLLMSRDELAQLGRLSPAVLLVVLMFQVIAQLAWNGAMWLPLRLRMTDLGFWELFMVRAGGFLIGTVIPVAGNIGVRLAYLRGRGLAYADFAWATLLTNALALVSVGGVATIAAAVLWRLYGPPPAAVLSLTAAVLIAGVTAVTAFRSLPRLLERTWFRKWSGRIDLGQLHTPPRVLTSVLTFALARHVANFMSFGLLYRALSSSSGAIVAGGLVYALTSPVRMVQIVPGNIGLNEWVVALVGGILSYDLTTGLLVAVVFRGMTLLAQALVALAGSWLTLRGQS